MEFYNLQTKTKSSDINFLFPNWKEGKERVVIFSPHDDDVILGAGYLVQASLNNEADVFVIIFNDGSAGYSKPELKEKIVELRKIETLLAFRKLGINEKNVIRFDLPDFTGIHYLGWKLPWKCDNDETNEGLFPKVVSALRKIKATRLIFPNGYREHIDHTAACMSALFDGPQVGDGVIVDHGKPFKIETFLQYSVWSKLSPEDAVINSRELNIRGNRAIVVEKEIEEKIIKALMEFKTQQNIISNFIKSRNERKISKTEKFIEIYLDIDPRPRFDYGPYKNLIQEIDDE